MNTTIRTLALLAAVGLAGTLGGCKSDESSSGSPTVMDQRGHGTATVTVLHSLTEEPLPGMPVTVRPVYKPETKAPIFVTNKNGQALIRGLDEGRYEVYVFYNNNMSETGRFEITGDDSHPFVTIHFNPDINN